MLSIKDYAADKGISCEAVRKQLRKYTTELEGHVHKEGRTQYLDEIAVEFLDEHRNKAPIAVYGDSSILELKDKIAELYEKLDKKRDENDLLREERDFLKEENRALKAENQKLLEEHKEPTPEAETPKKTTFAERLRWLIRGE